MVRICSDRSEVVVGIIVAALFGAFQVILLGKTLTGALNGVIKTAVISLILKFLLYAVGFTLLYFFFMDKVVYISIGLIVGIVIGTVITAVNFKRKGDDKK